MIIHFSNDFRTGLKIILDNEPYVIESTEFIKPGKGQTFTRVKLRHLLTGTHIEKIFKPTFSVESADIVDVNLNYLYNDSGFWYFINNKTFEQITADAKVIGDNAKWLFNQIECIVTLWNNRPITVTPPNFVELKIVSTNPVIKGDSINNRGKLATLSTGAVVKVPLFIQIGEVIKVDTRSGTYVSRVK